MAIGPEEKAKILVLNGLNWTYSEIAEEVGVSESTVGKYVNLFKAESVADGNDPESVFLSYYVEAQGARVADMIGNL